MLEKLANELPYFIHMLKGALLRGSAGYEAASFCREIYPLSSFFITLHLCNPWASDLESHTNTLS